MSPGARPTLPGAARAGPPPISGMPQASPSFPEPLPSSILAEAQSSPSNAKDALEPALHDLKNALSAARSFGDVLLLRAKTQSTTDPALVESLIRELDRMNEIFRGLRQEIYRAGDILQCADCGYKFVHRKATSKGAQCRRCKSVHVARWKSQG